MAIKNNETYPGRADNPSTEYPQGKARNRSAPDAHNGMYLDEKWFNDNLGFLGALLRAANIVPNGEVDTALNSQYFDALKAVIKNETTGKVINNTSVNMVQTDGLYAIGTNVTDLPFTDCKSLIVAGKVGQIAISGTKMSYRVIGGQWQSAGGVEVLNEWGDRTDATLSQGFLSRTALNTFVSIKEFGAVGDYTTDDTQALKDADDFCFNNGKTLFIPNGSFRITESIDKKSKWTGVGGCNIFTFPTNDDKVHLHSGNKHKLSGSNLVFSGSATASYNTEDFGDVRYAVKEEGRTGVTIHNLGMEGVTILADFDYKDSTGSVTTPLNDNRADYDVGLLLVNVEKAIFTNVSASGYWKKVGIIHIGRDPDNTTFNTVTTMGNIGLAILGKDGTNSGLNCYSCRISANDHHSRYTGAGEDWGQHGLYINIPSGTDTGSRNGIAFFGGTIATKVNVPVKYDKCGEILYSGVIFENPPQAGSAQAGGTKLQIGTEHTGNITFSGCRFTTNTIKRQGGLLDTAINAKVTLIASEITSAIEVYWGRNGVTIEGTKNNQFIRFRDSPYISTGAVLQYNAVAGSLKMFNTARPNDIFELTPTGIYQTSKRAFTYTLTSNALTVNSNIIRCTDGTLSTLNGGEEGMTITIRKNTNGTTFNIDETGNIRLAGNMVFKGSYDSVTLQKFAGMWIEVGRGKVNI